MDGGKVVRELNLGNITVEEDVAFRTVVRVTDGTNSTFYFTGYYTDESGELCWGPTKYSNSDTEVAKPSGTLHAVVTSEISVVPDVMMAIGDVEFKGTITLEGGYNASTGITENLASLCFMDESDVSSGKVEVAFLNMDSWISKTTTEQGVVYSLKDDAYAYVFAFSDVSSKKGIEGRLGIDHNGFRASYSSDGTEAKIS